MCIDVTQNKFKVNLFCRPKNLNVNRCQIRETGTLLEYILQYSKISKIYKKRLSRYF